MSYFYFFLPDPTTKNKKSPNTIGPTGNLSSFFYNLLFMNLNTLRELGTSFLSMFYSKISALSFYLLSCPFGYKIKLKSFYYEYCE